MKPDTEEALIAAVTLAVTFCLLAVAWLAAR